MKLYTSIDTLPIYNYFKCIDGDLRYLSNDIENIKLEEKHIDIFEKIQNEFEEAVGDKTSMIFRLKMLRKLKLQKQIIDLNNCVIGLGVNDNEECFAEIIKKYGLRFDIKADFETKYKQLKQILGEIENIKQKINEILNELEDKSKDFEKVTVFDIVANIQKVITVQIDVHTLPVAQLISYTKII